MSSNLRPWLDNHHSAFTAIRRDIHAHPELGGEAAAASAVEAERANRSLRPSTGGEVFAEMMRVRLGMFIPIGNSVAADGSYNAPHTREYDFNDAIIPDGIADWTNVVRQELGGLEAAN